MTIMNEEEPTWTKIEDFICEIRDPSGGIYRIVAKEEMNQEQLSAKWMFVYVFCGRERAKDGEVHLLVA